MVAFTRISKFRRRGTPEHLLPYRVARGAVSDQLGSVYFSINRGRYLLATAAFGLCWLTHARRSDGVCR
jgi:hypothetical protein